MVDSPSPRLPGGEAVDRARLAGLRAEVGDAALRRYAEAYLDLLAERLDRIERAMDADTPAEAIRVMVDLRVSSAMLGASRLAALIEMSERPLPAERATGGKSPMAVLRAEASSVARALYVAAGVGRQSAQPPAPPLNR